MKVYTIQHKTLGNDILIWDKVKDILEELKIHLEEGTPGDTIEVTVSEINEEDYNNLPEFKGY